MHEFICADDVASENLTDGLVTEADSEDRCRLSKFADDIAADPRFVRCAGAGGDTNFFGSQCTDFRDVHGIVADDFHIGTKLAKVLDEVVGEGVVVIDDEKHGRKWEEVSDLRSVF